MSYKNHSSNFNLHVYTIKPGEYADFVAATQDWECAICGRDLPNNSRAALVEMSEPYSAQVWCGECNEAHELLTTGMGRPWGQET